MPGYSRRILKISFFVGLFLASISAQSRFEKPPVLRASETVSAALRKGPQHEIAEDVRTDGFWHVYTVRSSLGDFTVHGSFLLRQRIQELYALIELRKFNEVEVAARGAAESFIDTGESLLQMARHPLATAEGVGPGFKRMFDKISSQAGEGLESLQTAEEKEAGEESAILRMAKDVSGVTAAERGWAKRFGVDPYTLNPLLRAELEKLSLIETGGRLAVGFVPIPWKWVVSAAATVGNVVWDSDPDELKQHNRATLVHFGMADVDIDTFEGNPYFGLTRQTALLNYLVGLGDVGGRGDFVARAAMADSEALAVFFVESARLYARFYDESEAIAEVLTAPTSVVSAVWTRSRLVYLLPVDHMVWTEYTAGRVTETVKGAREQYPHASLEVWLTGTASERTRAELLTLGVSLREEVFPTRIAPVTRLQKTARSPQTQSRDQIRFGGKYELLAPEQRQLIDRWFEELNRVTGENRDPQSYYDQVPLSARTTFEAVTHALTNTRLTTVDRRLLGNAIDLVEIVESVRGRVPRARGDLQFRIYVVLKPGAVDLLEESIEFSRRHDNTVYHKDYPVNYRLDKTPSVQFSITRTLERADIDVDYRSSSFPMVLFNGHLTAGNSDVRAGNNYERHVSRWQGFAGWWRHLFGLILPLDVPATFETEFDIPAAPRISGREDLEVAVHDFLKTWLVDRKPTDSVPYFSPAAYDCLLNLHGKAEGIDTELASVRLLHEMQLTNHLIGTPSDLGAAIRPVYSTNRELVVKPHRFSRYFSYYELPEEIVDRFTCTPPEGYTTVELSEEGGDHVGIFLELLGPHGDSEELFTVWKKESGYWKIVAVHLGPDLHHAELPDQRTPTTDSKSPIHADSDPEVLSTVQDFLTRWFIQRDYSGTEDFFSNHSHDCTNSLLAEDEEPNRTPSEAARHIRRSLQVIAEGVSQSTELEDMLTGPEPWHPDVYAVGHPDREAYLLATVPDSVAQALACSVRTPHAGVHQELPPHEGQMYQSAFHLRNGLEHPPVLFLLWARVAAQWKVVSYHVEIH